MFVWIPQKLAAALSLWTVLAVLSSCSSSGAIQRKRGNLVEPGRRIPPAAYAWYQRGLFDELNGDRAAAAVDFQETVKLDPKSGSAWAALGRTQCHSSAATAYESFSRGLTAAIRLGPIYLERGSCRLLNRGKENGALALEDGRRALQLEPDNPAVSTLIASALRALQRPEEAVRVERAAKIRKDLRLPPLAPDDLREVDRALQQGDLKRAQSLAQTLLSPGELAVRALAWGKTELAREQARLVNQAAPNDANAAFCLFLLGEQINWDEVDLSSASQLTLLLFALHIQRSVGESASQHFLQALHEVAGDPSDLIWKLLNEEANSELQSQATPPF